MGMQNPQVQQYEETDKFSDKIGEGEPFLLQSARVVNAKTSYGDGEFVLLRVQGQEHELGIWGAYLVAQVKSIEPSDLNRWYVVQRRIVEGFGKQRNGTHNQVKTFMPVDPPSSGPAMSEQTGPAPATA